MPSPTPGPWRTTEPNGFGTISVRGPGSPPQPVAEVLQSHREHTAESNARLIAAAPLLLAKLRSVEWSGTEDHPDGGTYPACPSCGGANPMYDGVSASNRDHAEDCSLAAALRAAMPPESTEDAS